jgi:plasmid stability protein
MRTTLTLDDDVAQALQETARTSCRSFKEVVNEVLRRGLATDVSPTPRVPRFRVHPKACGFRAGIDLTKLNQLVDDVHYAGTILCADPDGKPERTT